MNYKVTFSEVLIAIPNYKNILCFEMTYCEDIHTGALKAIQISIPQNKIPRLITSRAYCSIKPHSLPSESSTNPGGFTLLLMERKMTELKSKEERTKEKTSPPSNKN